MTRYSFSRCEVIPQAGQQVQIRIDGQEVTRWHYGSDAKRPFFFPVNGPFGVGLTRMGHPGASNHDHHRSVWFAHHKLLGINFWGEETDAFIRQKQWFEYRDGDEECALAVQLDWHDGHDPRPLVEQELIVFVRPLENGEWTLDLQSTFRPVAEQVEFQQSNYGFLAVRVSKDLSAHFGGGMITGASGQQDEADLFGKPNRWIDYSGPVRALHPDDSPEPAFNGVTYFDHPQNPNFPAKWHVREDGWMGASACRDSGLVTTRTVPLQLRYLLWIHDGPAQPERAEQIAKDWSDRPVHTVQKSKRKHQHYEIVPIES